MPTLNDALVWESAVGWTPEYLDEGPEMLERLHVTGFTFVSLTRRRLGQARTDPQAFLQAVPLAGKPSRPLCDR